MAGGLFVPSSTGSPKKQCFPLDFFLIITIIIIRISGSDPVSRRGVIRRMYYQKGGRIVTENRTTEFQREYTDNIKRTVVAFANTEGGRIYLGIDHNGTVHGVESLVAVMRSITIMIRESIRPDITPFTECTVETISGRLVVVLSVQRGTARPYYLTEKGVRPEGVYLRQDAFSVPASETAILEMLRETSGHRYEDARSIQQQLTFDRAQRCFSKQDLPFDEEQKRALNIIGGDGTYTNLGLLLSDQCVHTIKLAVFEGRKKSVFRARKELTGSLLAQLEDAYSYIDQFNHTHTVIGGLNRLDKRDYPPEALREALLNAIVHRDYSYSGSTLISIFTDRIEFVTIGGLAHGLTSDDILLGISAHRNERLANVLYRLGLVEAYGTGILRITESYADHPVSPRFEMTDNVFRVTLPNRNHVSERGEGPAAPSAAGQTERREGLPRPAGRQEAVVRGRPGPQPGASQTGDRTNRQKALLRLAEKQGWLVRKDVESHLKVSQATAILILREMVEQGLLLKEGTGKQQKYRAAK